MNTFKKLWNTMIRKRKRPKPSAQPEPCLFSEEEMAAMLLDSPSKNDEPVKPLERQDESPVDITSLNKEPVIPEESIPVQPSPGHPLSSAEQPKAEVVEPMSFEDERMIQDMISAMELFDKYYNPSKVRLIAMESANLARGGIHNGQIYELPAIPGLRFDGSQLTAIYYVSFARSFPSMIDRINLPLSTIYAKALEKYDSI